jgi:D-alanyl-D-alanine endopeptidase (penicillin-binding protein 7)
MVMQLASSSSVSRKFKQLSRWAVSFAVGGALVCASFASSATTSATSVKHHRKAAASAHAAPRARHVAMVSRKMMTALVISEANQSLDEPILITNDDIDTEKGTHSRLTPGTQLPRGVMLHLALMSSENRAANALGRNYPGGLAAFVPAMNAKAKELGMMDTHYVEPTGLSSQNKSSARDLAVLVNAAHQVPLLREYSTTPSLDVELGRRNVQFHTTDRLVANPTWDIGLQKTGFINEAGQCLVMQAQMAGRKLIMVLLDSAGKYSRIADAERIRKWVTANHMAPAATATARATVAAS